MSNEPSAVRVAAILPLFRYAVGPASGHSPAIPFYSLTSARAFFEEVKRGLPWSESVLYRRRWLSRTIETIETYGPTPEKP